MMQSYTTHEKQKHHPKSLRRELYSLKSIADRVVAPPLRNHDRDLVASKEHNLLDPCEIVFNHQRCSSEDLQAD